MHALLRRLALLGGLGISLAFAQGCSQPESPAVASDEIIGGEDAFESVFDAVPRLDTTSGSYCTGVLVAPRLILTAAHCVEGYDGMGRERPTRATFLKYDANGHATSRTFDATAILRFGAEERQRDDFAGYGIDIALVMLAEPVPADVAKPIPVRTSSLAKADVGKEFIEVGYGTTGGAGALPPWQQPRQKGTQKLVAVEGPIYPQMFATRAELEAYLAELEGPEYAAEHAADFWDDELYAYGHEVHTWGGPNGAQGCYGDSGGPLLQRVGSGYVVVGVVSNGESGARNECILGENFVRLNDQVLSAVAERAKMDDPASALTCTEGDLKESTQCAPTGELVGCRLIDYVGETHKQRVERCEDRGLTCKVEGGVADCR